MPRRYSRLYIWPRPGTMRLSTAAVPGLCPRIVSGSGSGERREQQGWQRQDVRGAREGLGRGDRYDWPRVVG